eukprot:RCo000800
MPPIKAVAACYVLTHSHLPVRVTTFALFLNTLCSFSPVAVFLFLEAATFVLRLLLSLPSSPLSSYSSPLPYTQKETDTDPKNFTYTHHLHCCVAAPSQLTLQGSLVNGGNGHTATNSCASRFFFGVTPVFLDRAAVSCAPSPHLPPPVHPNIPHPQIRAHSLPSTRKKVSGLPKRKPLCLAVNIRLKGSLVHAAPHGRDVLPSGTC